MKKTEDYKLDVYGLSEDIVFALSKSMGKMSNNEVALLIVKSNLYEMIALLMDLADEEYKNFLSKLPEEKPSEKKGRTLRIVED